MFDWVLDTPLVIANMIFEKRKGFLMFWGAIEKQHQVVMGEQLTKELFHYVHCFYLKF